MTCKYCDAKKSVPFFSHIDSNEDGIDTTANLVDFNDSYFIRVIKQEAGDDYPMFICQMPVNNCPMCGRKLGEQQ